MNNWQTRKGNPLRDEVVKFLKAGLIINREAFIKFYKITEKELENEQLAN